MDITYFQLNHNHTYIVLGSNGLIGNALINSFRRNFKFFNNNIFVKSIKRYELITESILRIIESSNISPDHTFTLIYSAGKGGYSLDKKIANEQTKRFSSFVNSIYKFYENKISFYLISSLGCNLSQIHSPYKNLILSNEKLISLFPNTFILRLPSIWGFKKNPLMAKGLIGNLLYSAKSANEIKIYGDFNTVRNYLSDFQISNVICKFICSDVKSNNIYNFSSHFNYSVAELIYLVMKITKKQVKYKLYQGSYNDKESYKLFPTEGENIKVLESLNTEIYKSWRNL